MARILSFLKSRRTTPVSPESVGSARQRLVQRNWRFSIIPRLALALLFLVLVWEVLRQNMCPNVWPWSIAILGVAPAATLTGIFASLLIAREQFARSMRPNLTWSCRFDSEGSAWLLYLNNFGPGPATIEQITYSVTIMVGTEEKKANDVSHRQVVEVLRELGLEEGRDYNLELITSGAALPVVKQREEGFEFAAFKPQALDRITRLTFRVRVIDVMGDHHEKSMPFEDGLVGLTKQAGPSILKQRKEDDGHGNKPAS